MRYTYLYMGRIVIIALVLFLVSATQSLAAMLYMDPNTTTLARGDTIKVSVRLDTDEGECINVVDGVISYPKSIQLVDVSRGSSILSMWVEDPVIDTQNNTVTFAGGIPNGYCGRIAGDPRLTNVVLDLIFQSPGFVIGATSDAEDVATVAFEPQTQVLLNDGLGTQAPLTVYGTEITLLQQPGASLKNEWKDAVENDTIPPEKFSISLERTPNAYSNDWFITFNTTDKQTGISYYEVIEETMEEASLFQWGATDAPWKRVKSPYVLKDQSLNSTIRVRAIDKAGNEYVATYVPNENQRTLSTQSKVLIALLGTIGFVFVASTFIYVLVLRLRKRKQTQITTNEVNDDFENDN